MLSLFENKIVEFTLSNGDKVSMVIDAVFDFRNGDLLDRPKQYIGYPTGSGWLLHGTSLQGDTDPDACEAYIEYDMKKRSGSCNILTENELETKELNSYAWLPDFWRQMMDLPLF
jgi:hypothetical protein